MKLLRLVEGGNKSVEEGRTDHVCREVEVLLDVVWVCHCYDMDFLKFSSGLVEEDWVDMNRTWKSWQPSVSKVA